MAVTVIGAFTIIFTLPASCPDIVNGRHLRSPLPLPFDTL